MANRIWSTICINASSSVSKIMFIMNDILWLLCIKVNIKPWLRDIASGWQWDQRVGKTMTLQFIIQELCVLTAGLCSPTTGATWSFPTMLMTEKRATFSSPGRCCGPSSKVNLLFIAIKLTIICLHPRCICRLVSFQQDCADTFRPKCFCRSLRSVSTKCCRPIFLGLWWPIGYTICLSVTTSHLWGMCLSLMLGRCQLLATGRQFFPWYSSFRSPLKLSLYKWPCC